jgi:hypothetical protein
VSAQPARLELERRRGFGELLGAAVGVFTAHLAVFLSVTLIVVAPVVIVLDGILGRQLADGVDADPSRGVGVASAVLESLVLPALVTALHAMIVLGLSRGEEPTVTGALRATASRLLPAVGAVTLYTVVVALGFLALIVPGLFLAVRCYFAPQSAVVEGLSPAAALRRSAELTKDRWWRCAGYLVASGLLFGLLSGLALGIAGGAAGGNGAVFVTVEILVLSVSLSLTALFGTFLFFDLRARRTEWAAPQAVDTVARERPWPGA